jgi:PAS domain S-box-containing protein
MKQDVTPTNTEVFFEGDDIIVSKTDIKGRLTYTNETFIKISGFVEEELIGQPHSLVRHPEMPRAIFKLLWDSILEGREIFAYVKNMTKTGDFYWVFAHVTPSFDVNGTTQGFHSNRRVPDRKVIDNTIVPLYSQILQAERQQTNGQKALAAGTEFLTNFLKTRNVKYDELIFSL